MGDAMTSKELVIKTIKGENPGRTPVYGWLEWEIREKINKEFGSIANLEDHYRFDMAHIFGGPSPFRNSLAELRASGEEITPDMLLDIEFDSINSEKDYENTKKALMHHRQRDRFCYAQTFGIFEAMNEVFGIENHLMYMLMYPDELKEVYAKLARWNVENIQNLAQLGMDGVLIADDWGSQKTLMFSPQLHAEMIAPNHQMMVDAYKKAGVIVGLHSDGCVMPVMDTIASIGYDFFHPWQENCGMPYSVYLDKYQDKFAILGGVCVQSTFGFGDFDRLESEIKRVFSLLKGKRWMCCTSHFVESKCTIEEVVFAYDLIRKLADEQ